MPIKPMQHMSIVTQGRVLKTVYSGFFVQKGGGVTKSQNLIIHKYFPAEKYEKVCLYELFEVLF